MSFHEVRLPEDISYGSSGGPIWSTDVLTFSSGFEKRNINWSAPKRRYNIAYGVRSEEQMEALLAFFLTRQGRAYGFRFKDWTDYKSVAPNATITPTDQNIGTGNASTVTFQLRKAYTSGGVTHYRDIKKPVTGTVRIALAGGEVFSPGSWSVNTTTGVITFTSPPGSGVAITAGYEFDVPCRFDADELPQSLDSYGIGSASNVPIVEIRV